MFLIHTAHGARDRARRTRSACSGAKKGGLCGGRPAPPATRIDDTGRQKYSNCNQFLSSATKISQSSTVQALPIILLIHSPGNGFRGASLPGACAASTPFVYHSRTESEPADSDHNRSMQQQQLIYSFSISYTLLYNCSPSMLTL